MCTENKPPLDSKIMGEGNFSLFSLHAFDIF